MYLFYQDNLQNNISSLNEEESKHCSRVLRLSKGDTIYIIDGQGTFCEAVISQSNIKMCVYEITKRITGYGKREFNLNIAIAPTKNIERFEWFLEKATEIGIDQITPLICRYSERKEIKQERLEKVIISAMKQSQKAFLPKLTTIIKFVDFLNIPFDGKKYIAHCMKGEKTQLKDVITKGENSLICIGPEGDFSPEEVEKAIVKGFIPVSLGDSRLRTETAGLVACHTVNLINQ